MRADLPPPQPVQQQQDERRRRRGIGANVIAQERRRQDRCDTRGVGHRGEGGPNRAARRSGLGSEQFRRQEEHWHRKGERYHRRREP